MGSKQFLIPVEAIGDAAFAVDVVGRISAWNNAAAELFGLSQAEAMNANCHAILQCSDENGIICSDQCLIERTAQVNRPLANYDLRVQTKIGKLWCNVSTLIASDPASGTRHTIHIVRPIEVQKRLEQAISEFVRTQLRNTSNGAPMISSARTLGINVRLTAREVEVLRSLAKGHRTRAIANQLNISSATVSNHIKHILAKFDVHTRFEAIRHAETSGMI